MGKLRPVVGFVRKVRFRMHKGFAVAVAVAVVAFAAAVTASAAAAQGQRFSDVAADHYAYEAVEWAAEAGVTLGYGDGTFKPARPLHRWHAVVFMERYYDEVLQAEESEEFTRGDMMVLLKAINDGTLSDPDTPDAAGAAQGQRFSDVAADHYAYEAVEWAAEAGVTLGYGDGTFKPARPLHRWHAVVFMERYYDEVLQAEESEEFTRGDMMVLLKAINDGTGSESTAEPEPETDFAGDALGGPSTSGTLWSWPVKGDWTIPVFICAQAGTYTAQDLEEATAVLNSETDGFFRRLSSGRMTLQFSEGSVLTEDLDWEGPDPRLLELGAFPCGDEATSRAGTSQVLILLDIPGLDRFGRDNVAAYARLFTGPAVAPPFSKSAAMTSYIRTVVHELGHSVLGLHHLKFNQKGSVFPNELLTSEFRVRPELACYQYEQLDWPVPDYAEPCVRLTPSRTQAVSSYGRDDDGRDVVTWEPPEFTDDAPVTGHTIRYYRGFSASHDDEPYAEYVEPADARSHLIDESIEPGDYIVLVAAHTRYGQGDFGSGFVSYLPTPPPLGPIRIANISHETIQLSWSSASQKQFQDETGIRVVHQIQYEASGNASKDEFTGHFDTGIWLGDLDQATEYTIRVRACSSLSLGKCSGWETITVSTLTSSELSAPQRVSVAAGSDWYLLTWDPVPGAAGYSVELPDGRGRIRTYAPDFFAGHGIQPNTRYSLRVGPCGPSTLVCEPEEWTAVAVSTTSQVAVPPPYRIGLREIDDSWVTVLWETAAGRRWLYRVEYEYTDGATSSGLRHHRDSSERPLRLTVKPDSTYTLKMRNCESAETNAACSTWTSFVFSTHRAASSVAPPSIRATDIADIWLGFTWQRVHQVFSYDWRIKKAADNYWRWGNSTEPMLDTLQVLGRLEPNTMYTAEVRSCGESTRPCSDWATSTVSTVRSLPSAPPSYPVSLAAVTDTQIHLAWNPSSPHTYSYTAKLFPTEDQHLTYTHTLESLAQDWVISQLTPNTAYTIAVRICQGSLGDFCDDWVAFNATTRSHS